MTRFERYATTASVLIGAGGLGLAALQYAESEPKSIPIPVEVTVKQGDVKQEDSKIYSILSLKTIGRNIEYIESIIGKPASVFDVGHKRSWREYQVDGCDLVLVVDEAKSVSSISLDVAPLCSFGWSNMGPNFRGLPEPNETTFGQFFRDPYTLVGSKGCVRSCGNAGDPEITLTAVSGGRATNWVTARVTMIVGSDREIDASAKLADVVGATISEDATHDLGGAATAALRVSL